MKIYDANWSRTVVVRWLQANPRAKSMFDWMEERTGQFDTLSGRKTVLESLTDCVRFQKNSAKWESIKKYSQNKITWRTAYDLLYHYTDVTPSREIQSEFDFSTGYTLDGSSGKINN